MVEGRTVMTRDRSFDGRSFDRRSLDPGQSRFGTDATSRPPGGPQPIGRAVSRLLARTGYAGEQASAALAAAWQEAAPESFRSGSQPGLVRGGVLEVFVSHSALVQEFGFHKPAVLGRLQALVPAAGITDIRLRVWHEAGRAHDGPGTSGREFC
jgi:hypothetical protein